MMIITVYEEGDIIGVRKADTGRVEDIDHYIVKDGELTKVPWYEASEYQNAFKKKTQEGTKP